MGNTYSSPTMTAVDSVPEDRASAIAVGVTVLAVYAALVWGIAAVWTVGGGVNVAWKVNVTVNVVYD